MRIIFETPPPDKEYRNKLVFQKLLYSQLKDFYKFLKKDIINNFHDLSEVNLAEHKDDLQSTYKMIFKKIVKNNRNTLLTYKVDGHRIKADINIPILDLIENDTFNIILDNLDPYITERVDLVFDKLRNKIIDIYNNVEYNYNQEITNLENRQNEIKNIIQSIVIFNNAQQQKRDALQKELNIISRQLENKKVDKTKNIKSNFGKKYDDLIVKNKSTLQSEHEISVFNEKIKNIEYQELAKREILQTTNNQYFVNYKKEKTWYEKLRRTSRVTHVALHLLTIDADRDFDVENPETGEIEKASHPHDKRLSAINTIGCLCTVRYRVVYKLQE